MPRKPQNPQPAPLTEEKPVDPVPNLLEQAAEQPLAQAQPLPDPEPQPPAQVELLATYAARIEEQAQPLPVCQITHPEAKDGGLHVGKYAGIRLVHGDTPAALLSDGSTI